MNRQELITQVKDEYQNLASNESQQSTTQATTKPTPEAYYEILLSAVITEIENGTFDNCKSGAEIVNKVAKDKSILHSMQV